MDRDGFEGRYELLDADAVDEHETADPVPMWQQSLYMSDGISASDAATMGRTPLPPSPCVIVTSFPFRLY